MRIVIVGAGRVGFRLAKSLSFKHHVTIIDRNAEALGKIQENIDVMPVVGNAEDPNCYASLEGVPIDLFIAVTNYDEINLVSTMIADEKMRVERKIVRLKNEFFVRTSVAERLGISATIYPYTLTALSVVSLLLAPKATSVKRFPETDFKLISLKIGSKHMAEPVKVMSVNTSKVAVVGIEREKNFFIPQEDDVLCDGDSVYMFGDESMICELCDRYNDTMPQRIRNIAIFGGDQLGIAIAKALAEHAVKVKIVEKDVEKCRIAAEQLPGDVTILNSRYGDSRLYDDEGLKNVDMLIASTRNDEENIIKCIEAKEHGIEKVVAINNDSAYYKLMHTLGIVVVRGPKTNAFYSILETIGSSSIVNEKLYCGGAGVGFVRDLSDSSKVERRRIEPYVRSNVASYLIADGQLSRFDTPVKVDDGCVVASFCARDHEDGVRQWINIQ